MASRKKSVPKKHRPKKPVKKSAPSKVRYRGSDGRFTTKRKWERKNLPKKSPNKKRKQPPKKKSKKKRIREGKGFTTKAGGYKYRVFILSDTSPESVEETIRKIKRERKPHPSLMYFELEVVTEENADEEEPESDDYGTAFFRFDIDNAKPASDVMAALMNVYQVAYLLQVRMNVTYSVQDTKKKKKNVKAARTIRRK